MFVLILLSFFSAAYTLYLYSYSQHGFIYAGLYSCSLGYVREFLLLFLHWLPLNLIILKVNITVFWVFVYFCFDMAHSRPNEVTLTFCWWQCPSLLWDS